MWTTIQVSLSLCDTFESALIKVLMKTTEKQSEIDKSVKEKKGDYCRRHDSTSPRGFLILQLDHLHIRAGRSGVQFCEFQGYTNDPRWNSYINGHVPTLEMLRYSSRKQLFQCLEEYDLLNQHILWSYNKSDYIRQHYPFGAGSLLYRTVSKLEKILFDVYKSEIIINSYEYGVIIPQPIFFPSHLRQMLQTVLLDLNFKSIHFIPESLLYCFGAGIRNGIVVEVSWEGVNIIPVYDFRILDCFVKATNRGYKDLHYIGIQKLDSTDSQLTCFYQLEEYASHSVSIEEVRNIFFPLEDNEHRLDSDEQSVSKLLIELVRELPIDIRKEMRNKVIITNKFLVPHFREILQEETNYAGIKIVSSLDLWQCTSLYADYTFSSSSYGEWPHSQYNNSR